MVQILPQVPNFGSQLAQVIGLAGKNIGEGLVQTYGNVKDKNVMEQLQDPNLSPMQKMTLIGKLSKEKAGVMATMYDTFLKGDIAAAQQQAKLAGQKELAEHKELLKTGTKEQAKKQTEEGLRTSLDTLDQLIPYTGSTGVGNIESILGAEGGKAGTWGGLRRGSVEARKQFDALGFWSADQVYTHFNKGTMSESKLNQVKKNLAPRADLSERENKARINAMRTISNLPKDIDSKKLDKIIDQETTKVQSFKSKKSLEEIWK